MPEDHLLERMDMRVVPTASSDFAMELGVRPDLVNQRGAIQGGLIATLVDVVAGYALINVLPDGQSGATSELSLHYLAAVTVGPARAEAKVVRRGRRSSVVQVEVRDVGRDVLAAVCTVSFAILELRPGQVDVPRRLDRPEQG